jgi:hypothetical protein
MDRVIKLSVVCGFLCVLLLAIALAVDGYLNGAGANRQHPPGGEGAIINVLIGVVFYGLTVWGIGAAGGLGAGLVGEALGRFPGKERK